MSELSVTRFISCTICHVTYPRTSQYFHRHARKPDGLVSRCKACAKALVRAWEVANVDRANARKQRWADENRGKVRQAGAKYRTNNAEREQESRKRYRGSPQGRQTRAAYRKAKAEELRAYYRQYYEANKERWKAIQAKSRAKHKDRIRAASARRRARERQATGAYTRYDVRIIHLSQGARCYYCDADINTGYHVDHLMPLSRGGTNWPENLACCCATCNLRKGNKTEAEFWLILRNQSDS